MCPPAHCILILIVTQGFAEVLKRNWPNSPLLPPVLMQFLLEHQRPAGFDFISRFIIKLGMPVWSVLRLR
jgi:hypothetical protein